MEITVKKVKEESESALSFLKSKIEGYQNDLLNLAEKGMNQQAAKLEGDLLLPAMAEYKRINETYEAEVQKIASETLSGIASGKGISDKRTERKYYPTYGVPGLSGEYDQEVFIPNPDKLRDQISRFTGKDPSQINVTDGLGVGKTINLEGQGDQEAQYQALINEFPGNVLPLTVAGKNNFLVTDKDGVTKLAFPLGIQGADVAATVATEAGPMASGFLAAAGVGSTGIGLGGVIPAFNAAYAGTKGLQTAGFRAAEGVDMRPGQIAGQAGIDFAVGTTIDAATLGTGRIIKNRFLTEGLENLVSADLKAAQQTLNAAGFPVTTPFTVVSGQRGLDFFNSLAGKFPNSPLGRSVEATRQVLAGVRDKMITGRKGDVAKTVVQKLDDDVKNLDRLVIKYDDRIKNSVKNSAQRAFDEVAVAPTNYVRAGETTADIVTAAKEAATVKKNQAFEGFERLGDEKGIAIQPDQMRGAIESVVLGSDFASNPKISDVLTRLADAPKDAQRANFLRGKIEQLEMSGKVVPMELRLRLQELDKYSLPFTVKRARAFVDELRQMVPDTMAGASGKDVISSKASKAANDVLASAVKKAELTKEWDEVQRVFGDEFVPFREGELAKISRDEFGKLQESPEKIIPKILSNYRSISTTLKAVRDSGDQAGAEQLKETLQRAYFEELGIANNRSISSEIKTPDPAKIEALFGIRRNSVLRQIEELQTLTKTNKKLSGVSPENISMDDAMALTKLMPEVERKKLIESIARKDKVIKKEEELAQNFFIKELKNGNIDLLDNQAVLRSLSKARTSDVFEIFSKLPPQIKKDAGADMMAFLFKEFSDPANKTRLGQDLWGVEKFNKTIGTWKRGDPNAPDIVSKLDAISGSSQLADLFISASKNLGANTPTGEPLYMTWRTMASPGREGDLMFKLYTTLEYPWHRALAFAYGNDMLKPFLSSFSKNISEETYQRNTNMLIKGTLGTSSGIKVAAQIARNDPEFAEQLPEIMKMVKEDAIQAMEEDRNKR
jgi:hypothetical protein